jgi:hypothetical protein
MSAFMPNNKAVMGLTLSHIGLMIASAVILTAAISFISFNDMQRTNELKTVASQLSTLVQANDAKSMEDTTQYWLPDLGYDYTVTVSTEYITVEAEGFWNNKLSVKQRFIIKPWVQNETTSPEWVGGSELHNYLKNNWQILAAGTLNDPIQRRQSWEVLLDDLNNSKTQNTSIYAKTPLILDPKKPVIIDKTVLYFSQPEEFFECKKGKDFDNSFGDNIQILGDVVIMESRFLNRGVGYIVQIPYYVDDIDSIEICIYYKAIWTFFTGFTIYENGPLLSLINWKGEINWNWFPPGYTETVLYKLNNSNTLGYSLNYKWYNETILNPGNIGQNLEIINETYGFVFVDLRTNVSLTKGSHLYISKVCVRAIPSVESYSDQQDYVFLYQ